LNEALSRREEKSLCSLRINVQAAAA
jgi:hypothetical protein